MLVNIPMKGHPELVSGSHRAAAGMLYTFIPNLACGIPKQIRDDYMFIMLIVFIVYLLSLFLPH